MESGNLRTFTLTARSGIAPQKFQLLLLLLLLLKRRRWRRRILYIGGIMPLLICWRKFWLVGAQHIIHEQSSQYFLLSHAGDDSVLANFWKTLQSSWTNNVGVQFSFRKRTEELKNFQVFFIHFTTQFHKQFSDDFVLFRGKATVFP